MKYPPTIAQELSIPPKSVEATVDLLDSGATVPFIARYRKEATGGLDEVAITQIRDRLHQLRELDKRRETILHSIQEQKKLTKELKEKILTAETLTILEDLYLPYRPKKRTRATMAKEKGLEPLAKILFAQTGCDPQSEARKYIDAKKGVASLEDALAGARDIMAEGISENSQVRESLRQLYREKGTIHSKVIPGRESEGQNYKDYFDWQEPVKRAPSHRILAVRRGEKEKFLTFRILVPEEEALNILEKHFVKGKGEDSKQVQLAAQDSFKRLLSLSMETEMRLEMKKRADQEAIEIFKNNLKQLLMAPPLGKKRILAIDPGLRTGCKAVCLDPQGKLLQYETLYFEGSAAQKEKAVTTIEELCQKFQIEMIAVGNGTGSREAEQFLRKIKSISAIPTVLVSETGASIYSASDVAREEFPKHDVTVRGAVSIGRRLMDPLAELVKIDPKSIGVGQYQHDVDQKLMKQNLDDVVMSCVNQVGVEVNTASKELLMYVSGLGPARAKAIIDYRNRVGAFLSREDFHRVEGLGSKAFEQAAGFLRIRDGKNSLDSSAVHPESYFIVEQMAHDLNCTILDLLTKPQSRQKVDLAKYVTDTIGMPTLTDIKNELEKPGRDPREPFHLFQYKEDVHTLEDLKLGMMLPGVITNVTAFGAFVDIGIHHDGLIHISQLSDRYVKDPHKIVHVHQQIQVRVLEIDLVRKRIALTLRKSSA